MDLVPGYLLGGSGPWRQQLTKIREHARLWVRIFAPPLQEERLNNPEVLVNVSGREAKTRWNAPNFRKNQTRELLLSRAVLHVFQVCRKAVKAGTR